MNRKQFIESEGATCLNWTWSWSFVNVKDRVVIFGSWEKWTVGNSAMILDENWEYSHAGRKQSAYPQAREHIRLVEEEGYTLKTFSMVGSDERKDESGNGPSKIAGFDPALTLRSLKRIGSQWFGIDSELTVDAPALNDTFDDLPGFDYSTLGSDSAPRQVTVKSHVKRDPRVRRRVIERATEGCERESCEDTRRYAGFLDVHHILGVETSDRYWNCVALCPSCHREAHFAPDREKINSELLEFAGKYDPHASRN